MPDVKNIVTLGIGASPGSLTWFITSGLESGAVVETPFEALLPYVEVKLRHNVVAIPMPPMQATDAVTTAVGSTRITQQFGTRVTRGGHTRVTRDYTVISRPELAVVKLKSNVITILVQE